MAISHSIQFRGEDQVLAAYQRRGVASWALFCNKQFLFKYDGKSLVEGLSELKCYLDMMSDSVAVLTLQVYEELGKGQKIKSNTACDGSFNFVLSGYNETSRGGSNGYAILMEQVKKERDEYKAEVLALNDRLDELEEQEMSDSGGLIGAVKDALMPHIGEILQSILRPAYSNINTSGAIGGVVAGDDSPVASVDYEQSVSDVELERVGAAYVVLRAKYPDILCVLEKLAKLSVQDINKFNSITSYFNMI